MPQETDAELEREFQARIDADDRIEPRDWMPAGYRKTLNARPVVDAGGGLLVADADLDAERVRAEVLPLLRDPARLAAMSAAAARYGSRDADVVLAEMVLAAASGKGSSA